MSRVKQIERFLAKEIMNWEESSVANAQSVSQSWKNSKGNVNYYIGSWKPWDFRDRALCLLCSYTNIWTIQHTQDSYIDKFDELYEVYIGSLKNIMGFGMYDTMASAIVLAVLDSEGELGLSKNLKKELEEWRL